MEGDSQGRQADEPGTGAIASYHEGMAIRLDSRRSWVVCTAGIIALGLLSRVIHTGFVILDKYLGDALYAMMIYGILRLFWRARTAGVCAADGRAVQLFGSAGVRGGYRVPLSGGRWRRAQRVPFYACLDQARIAWISSLGMQRNSRKRWW